MFIYVAQLTVLLFSVYIYCFILWRIVNCIISCIICLDMNIRSNDYWTINVVLVVVSGNYEIWLCRLHASIESHLEFSLCFCTNKQTHLTSTIYFGLCCCEVPLHIQTLEPCLLEMWPNWHNTSLMIISDNLIMISWIIKT